MGSDKPNGADNQQGSPSCLSLGTDETPQRLNAELLAAGAKELETYLQGALRDGTRSARHGTHRFSQSTTQWLITLKQMLSILGYRSWMYREGKSRRVWVLETTAGFLDLEYDPAPLVGTGAGFSYARGYFDADGGMPRNPDARLYFQLCQKDRRSLESVVELLESGEITCGRIHNPSAGVDPNYWRVFVRARSHVQFMRVIGSWHPVKRQQMNARMKI